MKKPIVWKSKDCIQITLWGVTWCKIESGWIGPDLKGPGFFLGTYLSWLIANEAYEIKPIPPFLQNE